MKRRGFIFVFITIFSLSLVSSVLEGDGCPIDGEGSNYGVCEAVSNDLLCCVGGMYTQDGASSCLAIDATTAGIDIDGDGYVNATIYCGPTSITTDCNDTNSLINPNATEICTDTVDNDCDGDTDCDDGYCDNSSTTCAACVGGTFSYNASSTVCRVSAGDCDTAENCSGAAMDCPSDSYEAAATECRATAGDCDVAEECSGSSADCPADSFLSSVCRVSTGTCDSEESCTGSDADCPSDSSVADGTICTYISCASTCSAGTCTATTCGSGGGSWTPSEEECEACETYVPLDVNTCGDEGFISSTWWRVETTVDECGCSSDACEIGGFVFWECEYWTECSDWGVEFRNSETLDSFIVQEVQTPNANWDNIFGFSHDELSSKEYYGYRARRCVSPGCGIDSIFGCEIEDFMYSYPVGVKPETLQKCDLDCSLLEEELCNLSGVECGALDICGGIGCGGCGDGMMCFNNSCFSDDLCISNVSCEDWSDCEIDYGFDTLVGNVIADLGGNQTRTCRDVSGCVNWFQEKRICNLELDIYIRKDGEDSIGVHDALTGKLLARLVGGSLSNPSLDIYLDEPEGTYPEHCSNGVLDSDEESIDCGGECIDCDVYNLSRSSGFSFWIIVIAFVGFGIVYWIIEK